MFGLSSLPRNLEAAVRDARAGSARVRAQAVRELAPHAEADRPRVLRALEEALADEDPSVRSAAALGLADVGASECLPKLLLSVEDEHPEVRQMALTALGELGDARATQRLRRALSDPRPEVRFQAVIAFPRVCSSASDAETALREALRDADATVQHIALRMLEDLAQSEGHVDAQTERAALGLLQGSDARVRVGAALLLARLGSAAAHGALVSAARGELRGLEPEDEAASIEWAGDLGLNEAIPGLERRAFGGLFGLGRDRFGWHARVALARLGHARATRELLGELRSWQRHRRTLAVAAVGRAKLQAARPLLESWLSDPSRAEPEAVAQALRSLDSDLDEPTSPEEPRP
jgi:HEAT repeat protein